MKTQHFFIVLAVIAILFTACKKDKEQEQEQDIPVTGITLNKTELMLELGDTVTLIATVQPDSATNKTVIWTSSNTSVATVNSNGLVTAIAKGDAIITVTTKDGNKETDCSVTVFSDYRDKWVGIFDNERIHSTYINMTGDTWSDTIKGIIVDVISKGDSLLYIVERGLGEYSHGVKHDVKVNNDGSFKNIVQKVLPGPFILGSFYKDSINIEYHYVSPGASTSIFYKGKKLKRQ